MYGNNRQTPFAAIAAETARSDTMTKIERKNTMELFGRNIANNYFMNKYVLFCGNLEQASRRDLSDRLFFDFGGVPLENPAAWLDVLVVGRLGESSAVYKQVKEQADRGFVTILTER
jgi:hypothetical protein